MFDSKFVAVKIIKATFSIYYVTTPLNCKYFYVFVVKVTFECIDFIIQFNVGVLLHIINNYY